MEKNNLFSKISCFKARVQLLSKGVEIQNLISTQGLITEHRVNEKKISVYVRLLGTLKYLRYITQYTCFTMFYKGFSKDPIYCSNNILHLILVVIGPRN